MAFKTPSEIAEAACTIGIAKTKMGWGRLLVLGFLAGAYIAFGSQLAVTAAVGAPWPQELPGLQKLIFGAVFPVGLMLVVIAGSELFTGNCMMPTIPCLKKRASWLGLLRNWLGSYVGNFVGALFVAYFLAVATGLLLKNPWSDYISTIAQAKCGLSFSQAFWRGVGCNWLVCLAVWLICFLSLLPFLLLMQLAGRHFYCTTSYRSLWATLLVGVSLLPGFTAGCT